MPPAHHVALVRKACASHRTRRGCRSTGISTSFIRQSNSHNVVSDGCEASGQRTATVWPRRMTLFKQSGGGCATGVLNRRVDAQKSSFRIWFGVFLKSWRTDEALLAMCICQVLANGFPFPLAYPRASGISTIANNGSVLGRCVLDLKGREKLRALPLALL